MDVEKLTKEFWLVKDLYEKEEDPNLKKGLEKKILKIARQVGEHCLGLGSVMMYVKICPECNKRSYSAAKNGYWKCSNCGKNLTDIPPLEFHATIDKSDNTTNKGKNDTS